MEDYRAGISGQSHSKARGAVPRNGRQRCHRLSIATVPTISLCSNEAGFFAKAGFFARLYSPSVYGALSLQNMQREIFTGGFRPAQRRRGKYPLRGRIQGGHAFTMKL